MRRLKSGALQPSFDLTACFPRCDLKPFMTEYVLHTPPDTLSPVHFTLNYDAELNAAQLHVVKSFDGPILVVAGAGSGKTRTLTYRVARMVESGIPPDAILLLTFTRKAAQEMLRRAAGILDARCEHVIGGTFHAFANRVLRRYGRAINIEPGFSIMDQADSEDAIRLLLEQLGINQKGRNFPKKNVIQALFSRLVNQGIPLEYAVARSYPQYLPDLEALQTLYREFGQYKLAHQLLDYDDLLLYMQRLLEEQPDVRRRLSETYRYIMVDEYQDTNKMQARIVRLLAATHENVMAVGDEAQSIYSFRGANYRNILDFATQFPGAQIIKLEENFRSVQPILNVTNDVIKQARESFEKRLFTKKTGGARPVVVPTVNERQQSQFIAQRVLELQDEGVALADIAILFRASFHAFDLELELTRRNIPFVKVGGLKFMEAAHIKDMFAYLRVLANPLDMISWHRILLLLDGIGGKTAQNLLTQLQPQPDAINWLAEFAKKAKYTLDVQRLGKTLQQLRALPLIEQIGQLREYYASILEQKYADREDVRERKKDLEQLNVIAENYVNLETFLTEMTLEPPSRSLDKQLQPAAKDRDVLTLSTIHSAKGLEWVTVFVIWLAEGRFPSAYALDDLDALEEELRLLYVATTRAMKNLYLTYPVSDHQWGNYHLARPSRFLHGIARQHVDMDDETAWNAEEA